MPATEARLAADLAAAMKARESLRLSVLRGLLTAVKNLRVERRGAELAEADVVQLVRREMRQRDEAESFALKAGRQELVDQARAERAILEGYVPAQLAADELEDVVRGLVAELRPTGVGPVMAALRDRYAGRFDGRQASEIARRMLADAA